MTTFWAAEYDVINEISDAIAQLTASYKSHKPFQRYKGKADDVGKFEDAYIGTRQFHITDGQLYDIPKVGYGYRFPVMAYEIHVQYPTDELWTRAAQSDMLDIRSLLLNNGSSTSGVQQFWPGEPNETSLTRNETDPFQILVVTFYVQYSVEI